MLITDLELRHAKESFSRFEQTLQQARQARFNPARFRLNMKLPHVSSFLSADEVLVATLDTLESTWKRLAKLQVDFEHPKLQPFDHEFKVHQHAIVRIIFWKRREPTQPIGHLVLSLNDLRMAANERLLVPIQGIPPSTNIAEVSISWITPKIEKVVLRVQLCVNKKKGWPFSNARLYYVLYTWKNEGCRRWDPIYRSEILTKLAIDPHSRAPMKYIGAMIRMDGTKPDENQTRQYRLEFFHYKATSPAARAHKLLAFSVFSLQQLRQILVPNGRLPLKVTNFPRTELVGSLQLLESTLEYGKSTFRLEASLGGEVSEHIIYVDIDVLNATNAPSGRISFGISVYTDKGAWEKYYWSELSPSLAAGECHTFSVAKLSEKKLLAGANRRCISFAFFQGQGRQQRQLGAANTTLSDLSSDQVLPVEGAGLLRVQTMERASNGVSRAHLALCFEYGAQTLAPPQNIVHEPMIMQPVAGDDNRIRTGRADDVTDDSPSNSNSS
ncbi:hypothetical protein FGB62_365g012 [Gracilaria domingensis]|nr:hypothetical protein FGB62_365g012 [Gracilaria domingensis]